MISRFLHRLIIAFVVLSFIGINEINALHIIGGDVVYKCISTDSMRKEVRYEITFTMYRDSKSNGANSVSYTHLIYLCFARFWD